jgi:quercetin dioxygenase-like cupin family protein
MTDEVKLTWDGPKTFDTHELYTDMVDKGAWPGDPAVPLPAPFVDNRGKIQNLLLKPMQSVAIIESKAGSRRASHMHLSDWHYAYVISGRVIYYERGPGETAVPEGRVFGPGEMFFTPPQREHLMYFPVDTTIITLAKNVRSHEEHEADLVRVDFNLPAIDPNGP